DCDGIGIVLTGDGLVAIDLDHCLCCSADSVCIERWAFDVAQLIDSYTEISPSGCGVHVFALGSLPQVGRRAGQFEMYDCRRFVTVTGSALHGFSPIVQMRPEPLLDLHRRFFHKTSTTLTGPPSLT